MGGVSCLFCFAPSHRHAAWTAAPAATTCGAHAPPRQDAGAGRLAAHADARKGEAGDADAGVDIRNAFALKFCQGKGEGWQLYDAAAEYLQQCGAEELVREALVELLRNRSVISTYIK